MYVWGCERKEKGDDDATSKDGSGERSLQVKLCISFRLPQLLNHFDRRTENLFLLFYFSSLSDSHFFFFYQKLFFFFSYSAHFHFPFW